MFPLIYGFILFTSQGWLAFSSPTKYDQRQTGDVNVQIDLKDVKVIALVKSDLLDDYMNYDYVYDYADFTLKPMTKPTTKPPQTNLNNSSESSTASSSTVENKSTESALLTTSSSTFKDESILETSTKPSESNTENISSSTLKDDEDLPGKTTSTSEETPEESSVQNRRPAKRCKGLDKTGRCLRRRISFMPLAMRVAPELVRSVRKRIAA